MPDEDNRRAQRFDDRENVVEVALDCVGWCVTTVAPTPAIHGNDCLVVS